MRVATQQGDVRFLSMPGQGREPQLSPLRIFGQAKKKITSLVADLSKYINDCHTFSQCESNVKDIFSFDVEYNEGFTGTGGVLRYV